MSEEGIFTGGALRVLNSLEADAVAKLPIEERLKRLVKLQKVAYSVGFQVGRGKRRPWGERWFTAARTSVFRFDSLRSSTSALLLCDWSA